MRKKVEIKEIAQICNNMQTYINELKEEREIIFSNINKLEKLGTSDNFQTIVSNLRKRLDNLDSNVSILEFYAKYIDETMNNYDSKFSYYRNKLNAYICTGDSHE